MVASDLETTAGSPSTETEDQHTQPKAADMIKNHRTEPTDLKRKNEMYRNGNTIASGPSTPTKDKPTKPKLADGDKRLLRSWLHLTNEDGHNKHGNSAAVTSKIYECPGAQLVVHPPLTLLFLATPHPFQHLACLAALTRHANIWLPENDTLSVGQKLNKASHLAVELQNRLVWLVAEGLPLVQESADKMAHSLRELAGKLKEPNGSEPGPGRVRQTWEAMRVLTETMQPLRDGVAINLRNILHREVKVLRLFLQDVTREMERSSEDITWQGCRTCAGHGISVLGDIVRSLPEIGDILCTGMVMVGSQKVLVLGRRSPFSVRDTAREIQKAWHRADCVSQQTRTMISQLQPWSKAIKDVELALVEPKEVDLDSTPGTLHTGTGHI
jgi:hypothetical protein